MSALGRVSAIVAAVALAACGSDTPGPGADAGAAADAGDGDAGADDAGARPDAGPTSCTGDRDCGRGRVCASAGGVHEIAIETGDVTNCVDASTTIGHAPPTWRFVTGGRPLAPRLCLAGGVARGPGAGQDAIRARELARFLATGVRTARLDVLWHVVQPAPGPFDFAELDPMIDQARAAGIDVLAILGYGTPWASSASGGDPFYPPDDPATYAAFVRATVEHFRGRVTRYEIWNEPNGGFRFFRPSPNGDAARYGELLAVATDAAKTACPECSVTSAGLFFHTQLINGALEFTHDLLDAHPNVLTRVDAYGFHPYTQYPPRVAPELDSVTERSISGMVDDARAVLALHAVRADLPIAVTEVGWPVYGVVTEALQAQYLVRALLLEASLGLDPLCWFTLDDGPRHGTFPPEDDFGLYRHESVGGELAKPARDAMATLARLGADRAPAGTSADLALHAPDAGRFALDYDGPSGRLTALWRTSDEAMITLDGETRVARDIAGTIVARPTAGTLHLTVGASPILVAPE